MKELTHIEGLFSEIELLKKKANLLDELLNYYNSETLSVEIPDNWGKSRISKNANINLPKTPRHRIAKLIVEWLPYSEAISIIQGDWDRVHEMVYNKD